MSNPSPKPTNIAKQISTSTTKAIAQFPATAGFQFHPAAKPPARLCRHGFLWGRTLSPVRRAQLGYSLHAASKPTASQKRITTHLYFFTNPLLPYFFQGIESSPATCP